MFTPHLVLASPGLRLGELQALQIADVQTDHLAVAHAWEHKAGLKALKWDSANGTSHKRKKHRKSRVRLSDEKRREILALARHGYSVRQIAQTVGIPKSTLYRWVTGPLEDEIQSTLRERERSERNIQHPAPAADDQGTEYAADQGTPSVSEGDVVRYREDWKFGGVKTSLGQRSPGAFRGHSSTASPSKVLPQPATRDGATP